MEDESDLDAYQANAFTTTFIEMRKSKQLTDFTILCANAEFPVHRAVLSAACPYFHAMFVDRVGTAAFDSMTFTMLNPAAVEMVLDHLYGAPFETPTETPLMIRSLIEVADVLQMTTLYDFLCEQYLQTMSPAFFADILKTAWRFQNRAMVDRVQNFLVTNLIGVVAARDFRLLDFSEAKDLLSTASSRHAPSDVIVSGILAWVRHDEKSRKNKMIMLFRAINLNAISSKLITDLVEHDELVRQSNDILPMLMNEATSRITHNFKEEEDMKLIFFANADGDLSGSSLMQYFDIQTHEWSCLVHLPFELPKLGLVAPVHVGGSVYFLGGQNNGGGDNEVHGNVLKYSLFATSFSTAPTRMTQPRSSATASALNGHVYCVGGRGKKEGGFVKTVERCDAANNGSWEAIAPTQHACYGPNMVTVEDRLFAADSKDCVIQEYVVAEGKWSVVPTPKGLGRPQLNYFKVPVAPCLGQLFVYFRDKSIWSYDIGTKEWLAREYGDIDSDRVIKGMWSVSSNKHLPYLLLLDETGVLHQYDPETSGSFEHPGSLKFMDKKWVDVMVT